MNMRRSHSPSLLFLSAAILLSGPACFPHESPGLHHWETASPDPDRIFLSFIGDPATSRAVTWRTDTSVASASAQIALATANPKFSDSALTLAAKTELVDLGRHSGNNQGPVNYHSAVFHDL